MNRTAHNILILFAFLGLSACQTTKEAPLFSYSGKNVYSKDLGQKEQDRLKKARTVYDSALRLTLDNYVIDRYIADQSKATGKSADELRKELLTAPEPTETEVDAYYGANRSKIPYPRKLIEVELRSMVKTEKQNKMRRDLLAKIYRDKKVKITVAKKSEEKK